MAQESSQVAPRYLTGDKAGLQEFLARFDVSTRFGSTDVLESPVTNQILYRYSSSTVMVCPLCIGRSSPQR